MTTYKQGNPYVVLLSDDNRRGALSSALNFRLPNFADDVSAIEGGATLISIRGQMDTLALYGSAAKAPGSTLAQVFPASAKSPSEYVPVLVRWIVLGGNQCVVDPTNILAAATTVFTDLQDMQSRAGLIFRVSGFHADNLAIIGYRILPSTSSSSPAADPLPQIEVTLSGQADLRGAHRLQVEVGNYTS